MKTINETPVRELETKKMEKEGYRLEEDDGKKNGVYWGKRGGKHWIWTK